jgi:hypothetical protein
MPKITYHDFEKAAPVVTWYGVEFKDGEIVDLDQHPLTAEQKAEMVLRADASAYYTVEKQTGEKEDPDLPPKMAPGSPPYEAPTTEPPAEPPAGRAGGAHDHDAGRKAAEEGKKRDEYKSAKWLKGFDERMEELEKEAKASKNTHPRR